MSSSTWNKTRLAQVAGTVSPPSSHSLSRSSTFQITSFPRGSARCWLLLPNYPWAPEMLQLFGDVGSLQCGRCSGSRSWGVWVGSGAWLKVLNCLGGKRKGNSEVLGKSNLQESLKKVCIFNILFSNGPNFLSFTTLKSNICLSDKSSHRAVRNTLERQIHWSFWLECLVCGLNDWQFDSWQTDTDWSIGA